MAGLLFFSSYIVFYCSMYYKFLSLGEFFRYWEHLEMSQVCITFAASF